MQEEKKFLLRIESSKLEMLKKVAKKNDRSINGQINFIIKSFLEILK